MSSRDRTAYWVQSHSEQAELHSPSVPPSELDESSSPSSDTGSSHSIPPKMVLRYDDGRPDLPLPRADRKHNHGRGRRHVEFDLSPQYANLPSVEVRSRAYRDRVIPNAPEEIRVLPSTTHQSRSRSLPRTRHESVTQPRPKQSHGHSSSHSKSRHPHSGVTIHPPSSAHNYGMYKTVNGYPNPSHVTPNGVIYSHSVPPVIVRHVGTAHPERHLVVPINATQAKHPRSRSISLHGPRPVVIDRSDVSSSDSEDDAYYGSRRRRDKKSASATSHDKSSSSSSGPPTPGSRASDKRPFFQRLFSFTGKPSPVVPPRVAFAGDEVDGRRRHSINARR